MLSKKTNATLPQVMGILNVTPDSFSDGGQFIHLDKALYHAEQLYQQGADIIDIGGESTRPNAAIVSVEEELERVIPLLERIKAELPVEISVDTYKPKVMAAAIEAGANLINDVRALQEVGGAELLALHPHVSVCLMHMQGTPQTMQDQPFYENIVEEIKLFLKNRVQHCDNAGILPENIMLDVGFGFGKTLAHNLLLMRELHQFVALGYPVLVGVSRKSMIGNVLNKTTDQRLYGGLALATLAVQQGAALIRTHDVTETVDCIKIVQAVMQS